MCSRKYRRHFLHAITPEANRDLSDAGRSNDAVRIPQDLLERLLTNVESCAGCRVVDLPYNLRDLKGPAMEHPANRGFNAQTTARTLFTMPSRCM
jgi:hypothetical protein